jgi:hypothetical protein
MENMSETFIDTNKASIDTKETIRYEKPTYLSYIEYNEGLEWKHENINLDEKSEIVNILKPINDSKSKSLEDKLLVDIKFPTGYTFSMAGRLQTSDTEEFDKQFTLSTKICDSNSKELNPESRIIINKEKDIDEYQTRIVRLESTFYKNISPTKFRKESPNSIKAASELYKFDYGVEFDKGEHLRIYVVDPDIEINPENVELNVNLDKWEHH